MENLLYENDYTMLIAKEKVGKSILALQLACSISSATPFLNLFKIPIAQRVWYFVTEGKDWDIKQRLINMHMKVPINKDNLVLVCSSGFRFNSKLGMDTVQHLIANHRKELPKVIIIDALYMAIKGSLKDDQTVNDFTYCVRQFAEVCDAAVLIVHHSRRPAVFEGVQTESYSDDDIYGSAFLKASVDHCFYMGDIQRTNRKFLKCETQRSGDILGNIELVLVEPSPLYFEIVEQHSEYKQQIVKILSERPSSVQYLISETKLSKPTIYLVLKELDKFIDKKFGKPTIYSIKKPQATLEIIEEPKEGKSNV